MSDRGPPSNPRSNLEAEMKARQEALQQANEIIAKTDQPFIEQVNGLLAVIRKAVGTDYAAFSSVDGKTYVYEALDVPPHVELPAESTIPLSELPNCQHVVETEDTHALEDIEAEARAFAESVRDTACYLGVPVFAGEGVYGTICCYDSTPRNKEFSEWEVTFVEFVSNWVSGELERRKREQSIRDAKLQMEAAVEAGAVGTWRWDIPENELITGPSFAETFGVDPEAAREGVPLERFVSSIHEDDRERVERQINDAVETCGEYEVEYRVWNEEDELRWVTARGHVECADDGTALSFPGALIDITDRKHAEQGLKALNKQLRASNDRLEQFAHAASHDLQEPLRMISSYLQLLETRRGEELDEEAHEYLEYAVNGADRMREMVDGLLEFSRVETRGVEFDVVDLNDVLVDVQTDLQRPIAESGADITVEELPHVEGDRDQLRQLFQNLLENAIQYSGEESPVVYVSAKSEGDGAVVSVSDEGIGIDSERQERIFEVFSRLHPQEDYEGTGLGLALCQRIVEGHGGDIWVESEAAEGATFFVSLPS